MHVENNLPHHMHLISIVRGTACHVLDHGSTQPVLKAYRKWCVKFRMTPSVRTGFPAVIQHSVSQHLKCLKSKTWNDLTSANMFFFQGAECALWQNGWSNHWATGILARWIGFLFVTNISKLSTSKPSYLHSFLMHEPKDMREKNIEPEVYREEQVTNIRWCVLDHDHF